MFGVWVLGCFRVGPLPILLCAVFLRLLRCSVQYNPEVTTTEWAHIRRPASKRKPFRHHEQPCHCLLRRTQAEYKSRARMRKRPLKSSRNPSNLNPIHTPTTLTPEAYTPCKLPLPPSRRAPKAAFCGAGGWSLIVLHRVFLCRLVFTTSLQGQSGGMTFEGRRRGPRLTTFKARVLKEREVQEAHENG